MDNAQPGDPLQISAREWNEIRRKNTTKAQGGSTSTPSKNPWFPEIYFAKVPVGGIPARVGIVLGSATCELYTRNADDELVSMGRSEVVWNAGGSDVQEDEYIIVATEGSRRDFVVVWQDPGSAEFITDLRLDGSNLQYEKGGVWITWETITDCPEGS